MLNDLNPAFIRPVQSDEFLPPISIWTTIGGLFLVGGVGAAVGLATFVKYNVTVKAAATVRPTGEIRIVQAAIAGSIKSILVKENSSVKQGMAIATIDDSQLQTKKNQLAGNIQNSQLQNAQIDAQIVSLNNERDFELSLMNHNIAAAQANLQSNQREYQERQVITQTEVQEALAVLELAKTQMEQYQHLASTGAVAQLQIKEKEQAFKAAQAKLERSQASLNPSAQGIAIAKERIAQERTKGEITQASLNKERELLLQRQIAIHNDINYNLKELRQVETELKKTVLQSPDSGKILKLELRNPGEVVSVGQPIAQIAPGNAELVVKARVMAQDISNIHVCEQRVVTDCQTGKVQMRISAYPYPDYGILKGAVRAISADIITPQTTSAAVPYYEVTIQPERPYLIKGDRSYPLKSGMEVTADIISQEETLLKFVLRKARLLTNL
jgi:HlyD family type I secretion membrane fusion protein